MFPPAMSGLTMVSTLFITLTTAYITTPEQYGAVGDGKTNDWVAIQHALASCTNHHQSSACRIDFTQTYLSGPIIINTSSTTLNVTGSLLMLPKKHYPMNPKQRLPFISNVGSIHDVRLTGSGTIGNHVLPLAWWACKITGCWRPHLIVFSSVTGVRIDNLHFRNPPNHFIEMNSCTYVRVNNIDSRAPHQSPNTDGINFYGGFDQSLTNSYISNGDDCVSVVPIGEFSSPCIDTLDPSSEACRGGNVVVNNVTCIGGHGIAIGGVRHGTVSNVTFSNMTATGGVGNTQGRICCFLLLVFVGLLVVVCCPIQPLIVFKIFSFLSCLPGLYSPGGIRIKSYPNSTGSVYDIRYKDIILDDVFTPLSVLTRYCPWPCNTPDGDQACQFHDISFDNIVGHGRLDVQGFFNCSQLKPCYNISLNNVHLKKIGTSSTFQCSHVKLVLNNTSPSFCSNISSV